MYVALPPLAVISRATFLPSSSRTSPSTTAAPSRENMRPSTAPWPRAPPLISATFPSSRPIACLLLWIGAQPVDVGRDARLDRVLGLVADFLDAGQIRGRVRRVAGRPPGLQSRAARAGHGLADRLDDVLVGRGAPGGDVVDAMSEPLRGVDHLDAPRHVLDVGPVGLVVLEDLAVGAIAEVGLGVPGGRVAETADRVVHAVVERTVDASDAERDH